MEGSPDLRIAQARILQAEAIANPLAAILSFEMAQRLWGAVKVALEEGARTRDIGGRLGTNQMGDAVLKRL